MQTSPAPLPYHAEDAADSAAIAISIIVPTYNIVSYLNTCLHSLLEQQHAPSYEIILVDDGSSDGSSQLCQHWATQHPDRIRFIQQAVNQGVSIARNTALEQVRGEYFTFVDGDDLLPPEALQQLYEAAKIHSADIVKGNNDIFNEHRCYPANYNCRKLHLQQGDAILNTFYEHRLIRGHTWGKLLRSDRFAHIRFQPGVAMAQDALYYAEVFSQAKSLVIIPHRIYQYRLRPGSATNKKYETGVYRWWLYSIEQAGNFSRTKQHKRSHKALQLRTLMLIGKEIRNLPISRLANVIGDIRQRQQQWQVNSLWSLLRQGIQLRGIIHFLQLQLRLAQLERRINSPFKSSSANT